MNIDQEIEKKAKELNKLRIKEIVSIKRSEGNHEFQWNSFNLPTGLYFIKLQVGNNLSTQIIIKH
jgi:negative regulator of sigma E activity